MKIAFAGAGYIINIHAWAVRNNGLELAEVAERFPEKAAPFVKKFRIKNNFETVEQMLAAGGVEPLVIGTRRRRLPRWRRACMFWSKSLCDESTRGRENAGGQRKKQGKTDGGPLLAL